MNHQQVHEALDTNMMHQEAAFSIREGYERLYYGCVLRGQLENAQKYRELTHAIQDEIFDLQAANFSLSMQLRSTR